MAEKTLCFTTLIHSSGKNENSQSISLWQFLLDLLISKKHETLLKWTGDCSGEFKFLDAEGVAKLWGERRNKPKMNYDKMSRALRYYYSRGFLVKVEGKKFVYKFLEVPESYQKFVFGKSASNKIFTNAFNENKIVSKPYAYKSSKTKNDNMLTSVVKCSQHVESVYANANQLTLSNDGNSLSNCFQSLQSGQFTILPNPFDSTLSNLFTNVNQNTVESFNNQNLHLFNSQTKIASSENSAVIMNNNPSVYEFAGQLMDFSNSHFSNEIFYDYNNNVLTISNNCLAEMLAKSCDKDPIDLQALLSDANIDLTNIKHISSTIPNDISSNDLHIFSPNINLPAFISNVLKSSCSMDTNTTDTNPNDIDLTNIKHISSSDPNDVSSNDLHIFSPDINLPDFISNAFRSSCSMDTNTTNENSNDFAKYANIDLTNFKDITSFISADQSAHDQNLSPSSYNVSSCISKAFTSSCSLEPNITDNNLNRKKTTEYRNDSIMAKETYIKPLLTETLQTPGIFLYASSNDENMEVDDDDSYLLDSDQDNSSIIDDLKKNIDTAVDAKSATDNLGLTAKDDICGSDERSDERAKEQLYKCSTATKGRPVPLRLSSITFQRKCANLLTPCTGFVVNSTNSDQKVPTPLNRIHFWTSFSPIITTASPKLASGSPKFKFPSTFFASPRVAFSPEIFGDNLRTPL